MNKNNYLIEIFNLSKKFTLNNNNETIEIIKNLNLKVKKNSKICITGPSGSGKTTILNIIGLLDKKYSGNYLYNNRDVSLYSDSEANKEDIQRAEWRVARGRDGAVA